MKRLILFLTIVVLSISLASCKKVTFDESKKQLVIGMECEYTPFNWVETTKTETNYPIDNLSNAYAEGYDVQIAKIIAEQLGYTLVIKKIDWDGLIQALKTGLIDGIIAGMSPTEERKQNIDFSNSYYESTHVILSLKTSKYVNATKYADLNDAKVMGQRNTSYEKIAKEISEKNSTCKYINALTTVPLIVTAIKAGTVDITPLEEPVAKGLCVNDSSLTYFKLDEVFTLEESDKVVSIGLRKTDTALKEKINNALANISSEQRRILMETAVAGNDQ